jgi:hypothetical protein
LEAVGRLQAGHIEDAVLRNFDFEVAGKLTSRGAIATFLLLVQTCKLIIVVSRT